MIPATPFLTARYAVKGFQIALVGLLCLLGIAGCTTQTIRLEGFQVRVPIIGTIGPQGWKPYAKELEGEVRSIRIDLELSEARHVATKRAYEEAQAEAARMEAERLARVVEQQERITDEVRQDYSRRIADLRKRANRLQAEARTSAGSAPDQVRVSETGNAASGIDEAPDCATLPARDVATELNCRAIAEEQAMQLDALITWVQRQLGVTE